MKKWKKKAPAKLQVRTGVKAGAFQAGKMTPVNLHAIPVDPYGIPVDPLGKKG